MRILLTLLLALFTTPAFAQGWNHYDNPRFGYGVDIPPGFTGSDLSDNGDGQGFQKLDAAAGLVVWGGYFLDDFETEVSAATAEAEADAWNITGQTTTPRWAEFSALKGIRILHQRMVMLCDGSSYAAFRVEYSVRDSAEMETDINRLTRSLRGDGC
ncbi:hypothetical protein [Devosia sp. A449]